MTEESSEEEMNLMNEMDKKVKIDQLQAYPSQSVSKKSKTCFIFSFAFILMAIMDRNSSSSIVPLLSWKVKYYRMVLAIFNKSIKYCHHPYDLTCDLTK